MSKISLLPLADPPTGAEIVPVIQGGVSKQMRYDTLAALFVAAAHAMANYRPTFAQAIADFAVDEAFSCDETGALAIYRRIAAAPNYALILTVPSAAQVAAKADIGHAHVIDDITGLQGALDGKAGAGHIHTIGNVTGLQGALDGKAVVAHGHSIADLGLSLAVDGNAFDALAYIGADGVLTVGHTIDFHTGDNDGQDFAVRVAISGTRLNLSATGVSMAGAGLPHDTIGLAVGKTTQASHFVVDIFGVVGHNLYYSGGWLHAGNGHGFAWTQSGSGGELLRLLKAPNNIGGAQAVAGPVTDILAIDQDGLYVGSFGGDYGRAWRGVFKKDVDGAAEVAIINGTVSVGARAQLTRITATPSSFCDWGLIDGGGAPYDLFSYGAAILWTDWSYNGSIRMRLEKTGLLRLNGGAVPRHANTNYASHNVTVSSANPSGGADGDVWYLV